MTKLSTLFKPHDSSELPSFACLNPRKTNATSDYTIYPINGLRRLLDSIQLKDASAHHVRYLIDRSYKLWFAEEGCANKVIPSHEKMTGEEGAAARCVTAGNIVFSQDMTSIVLLNHKSGDFRPSFDSVKWLLAVLVVNEQSLLQQGIQLPSHFQIEQLTSSGGLLKIFDIEREDLIAWVHGTFSPEQLGLMTPQPLTDKTVHYESSSLRVAQFFLPASKIRRLDFDECVEETGTELALKP